jgi:histidyl-tRNA synthetase
MFKYANKHNFEYAVMIGEEEMNNNQVKIKNLKTQEQYYVAIEDILGGKL